MIEFWIVVIVIVIVFGGVIYALYAEKKRTESLKDFADELGLDFFPKGREDVLAKVQQFKLFSTGHSRKMKNLILGTTEIASIAIFDYQYTTGSGKNSSTHSQTVVSMQSSALTIPDFTLRPEGWFGSALGFQDIDFDNHPEFSKLFVLKGENEASVREFFDDQILDFFVQRKGITFEGASGVFVYCRRRTRTSVQDIRKYLEEGYAVYSGFMERLSR
jgi:hypothetical protein